MADEIFAKTEGVFGRRLVAGAFVFSVGLGLVATNCVNAFSYGYDKLRFIKPVFIGDTITAEAEVVSNAHAGGDEQGHVGWHRFEQRKKCFAAPTVIQHQKGCTAAAQPAFLPNALSGRSR